VRGRPAEEAGGGTGQARLVTTPKAQRIFVCKPFLQIARSEPDEADVCLIHDMLHTLGSVRTPDRAHVSLRLDRNDAVYVANSTARFRTGFWVMRDIAQYRCGTAFTTDQVAFTMGPNLSFTVGLPATVNTGWSFMVQR
jgi:hypothetical protein